MSPRNNGLTAAKPSLRTPARKLRQSTYVEIHPPKGHLVVTNQLGSAAKKSQCAKCPESQLRNFFSSGSSLRFSANLEEMFSRKLEFPALLSVHAVSSNATQNKQNKCGLVPQAMIVGHGDSAHHRADDSDVTLVRPTQEQIIQMCTSIEPFVRSAIDGAIVVPSEPSNRGRSE